VRCSKSSGDLIFSSKVDREDFISPSSRGFTELMFPKHTCLHARLHRRVQLQRPIHHQCLRRHGLKQVCVCEAAPA
jgi:hypothetical protein